MKTLDTLIPDIYAVVSDKGGWDKVAQDHYLQLVGTTMWSRLGPSSSTYSPGLRMSNIGQKCERKLWYNLNSDVEGHPLPPNLYLRFLMGDMVEDLILSLAMAAGHTVTGQQDTIELYGIKGHRDAVIDGVNVDVKSASATNFGKFKSGTLMTDDPYGYIWQLASYVKGSEDDPLVTDKTGGAFLAMNINTGELALDYHDFRWELDNLEKFYQDRKDMVKGTKVPKRGYSDVPHGKSGAKKLDKDCSFCEYKRDCWKGLTVYDYGKYQINITKEGKYPLKGDVL